MACYSKYKTEFAFDPEKEMDKIRDEEDWPTADELEKQVKQHRKDAQRLQEEIPESMCVSFFRVNCKTIRDSLSEKHNKIADEMVEIISKMAKAKAIKTIHEFDKINVQIETSPADIEELSKIKETMEAAPKDVEKLRLEINACVVVYEILERFQYKFADEEDYERRWRLVGAPGDTLSKKAR